MSETWDLWFPGAGATGVSFARARVDPAVAGDRVLVHAALQLVALERRVQERTMRDGAADA